MSSVWGKANPEKSRACSRKWAAANRDKAEAAKKRWRNGKSKRAAALRIARELRLCIWRALRGVTKKPTRAVALVGCSMEELKAHLEKQFKPGMTWENHTRKGWHIDHIKPCSKFNLKCQKQQKLCFHYTNTQPLWAVDNRKKNDHEL